MAEISRDELERAIQRVTWAENIARLILFQAAQVFASGTALDTMGYEGCRAFRKVWNSVMLIVGDLIDAPFDDPKLEPFTVINAKEAEVKVPELLSALADLSDFLQKASLVGTTNDLTGKTISLTEEEWSRARSKWQSLNNRAKSCLGDLPSGGAE